jgi:hypothetical protein
MRTKFWSEYLKEADHSENLGVDGKIISKRILGIQGGGVDWMNLAQDRNQWRTLVSTVMNVWVP